MTSDKVNSLTPQGEVFYRRLMSILDDYGRYDGREAILLAQLYPLQMHKVKTKDISRWMKECVKAKLLYLYVHGGKPYIEVANFRQRLRAKVSKWPAYDGQVQDYTEAETYSETETHSVSDLETVEEIYNAYPKRVGKANAIKSISKALEKVDAKKLLEVVKIYAKSRENQDMQYTKHPATWFNQQCWEDDQSTWFKGGAKPVEDEWAGVSRGLKIEGDTAMCDM